MVHGEKGESVEGGPQAPVEAMKLGTHATGKEDNLEFFIEHPGKQTERREDLMNSGATHDSGLEKKALEGILTGANPGA